MCECAKYMHSKLHVRNNIFYDSKCTHTNVVNVSIARRHGMF